jgi:hypothetical protein
MRWCEKHNTGIRGLKIIILRTGILTTALMLIAVNPLQAAPCSSADIVNGYQGVLKRIKAKDYTRALPALKSLADAGHGPAQRHLAVMLRDGKGIAKSVSGAALWSELAFRSGDKTAKSMTRDLRGRLDNVSRGILDQRLKAWRAARLACSGAKLSTLPVRNGDTGKELIQEVSVGRLIDDRQAEIARRRFPEIIKAALGQDPSARIYLDVVDNYQLYTGGRYHRYTGWKKNRSGKNIMRVPTNAFNDKSLKFFARMVTLTAKRWLYGHTPDAEFDDPLLRVVAGKNYYGSVYPDIRNGRYYQVMRQAFEMAKQLPRSVRKYIDIIDEVHYNPISKHFNRAGAADAAAYYNKILSFDGKRMMFVRRNVRYGSPLFFMQTFVHEGTHAVQDKRAQRYHREIPRMKKRLGKLQQRGRGNSPAAQRVKKDIDRKFDYVMRWYKGVEKGGRRIADMSFECEATENEIRAIKAAGGSPRVMKASGYLKLCPEAQKMLVQWQNSQAKNRRR